MKITNWQNLYSVFHVLDHLTIQPADEVQPASEKVGAGDSLTQNVIFTQHHTLLNPREGNVFCN